MNAPGSSSVNKLGIDFTKVNYEDVKTNMKVIIQSSSVHSVVQLVFLNLIPVVQIYLFNNSQSISIWWNNQDYKDNPSENIHISLLTFCFAFLSLKLFFVFTEFANEILLVKYCKLFHSKKYYEMGDLFRKTVFISVLFNIVVYFPCILIFNYLMQSFTGKIEEKMSDVIYSYHIINHFTLIFYSFNKPLQNLMLTFKRFEMVDISVVVKFLTNAFLCKYWANDLDYYFLKGIAISDLLSEVFTFVFLLATQYWSNPYPQAWIRINLSLFNIRDIFVFFIEVLTSCKSFVCFVSFSIWKEFLLFLFAILTIEENINNINNINKSNKKLIKTTEYFAFMILLTNLFFSSNKFTKWKTVADIYDYILWKTKNNKSVTHDKTTHLLTSYKDDIRESHYNYNSLKLIKTKILSNLCINIFSFFIFYLIFFFNFLDLFFKESIFLTLVLFSSFNGIISSLLVEIITIENLLNNKEIFTHTLIGFIFVSFPIFMLCSVNKVTLVLFLIAASNCGCYYCLYKFYKFIKQIDMRIVTLETQIDLKEIS